MATKANVQIETTVATPMVLRDNSEVSLTVFRQFINVPGAVGAIVPDAATEILIESTEYYDWFWDGTATDQWFKLVAKTAATGFIFTLNSQLINNMARVINPDEYTILGSETIWFHDPITTAPPTNETFITPYGNTFHGSFAIDTGDVATDIARQFYFHAQVDGSDNLLKMNGWLQFQDNRFVKTF
ncbi:MAG: hypothetical protein KAI17_03450 [Thiotrichaceae bacterium]|nr:hypothetical protein [Thiotrichaceae bacterium]